MQQRQGTLSPQILGVLNLFCVHKAMEVLQCRLTVRLHDKDL